MKVLIIHQHFKMPNEGGAIRSYYLAKALAQSGFQPVVITAGSRKTYQVVNVENIEIHYLPVAYDNRFGFWKRVMSFLKFAWQSAMLAKTIKGISVCYAISVPLTTGLTAQWLKRSQGIPYFFEVGDLWPDAPIELGYIKSYVLKRSLYALEKSIYQDAKAIVALSTSIQSLIGKKVQGKQIHLIPNMADTEFYQPEPKAPALITHYGVESKFVISYVGAVGVANGLDYYIDCARACFQSGLPVHFLICGEGALLEQHKENVNRLQLDNMTFIPFSDRAGVRDIMNVTDAAFVCYKPYAILETGSPNKYFDGLAAGKLIIINFEGWIKREIEMEQCGICINRQRPGDFVKMIQPFLANEGLLQRYQQASRNLAVSRYSRKILSSRFIDIFRT